MRWLPLPMLLLATAAGAADLGDLQQLLDRGQCQRCRLADADLVHAQLRGATLERADLSRANLNRANLQGANLRGTNLRETMLQGADLSGADLRGALLEGCDLRDADLTSARLDKAALSRSYWQGAKGVPAAASSYADLHNAGVEAALQGRHPQAEQRFSEAIGMRPNGAISWLARGIARTEQAKQQQAAQDFAQAARLYRQAGEIALADQLDRASRGLLEPSRSPGGNGLGSSLVGGAAGLLQQLAPYALKLMGRGLF